jgi:RNA polymerase sigma factor (sigma-70 family)
VELGVYSNLVTASGTAQAREHLARVEACLQGLPEAQREAVLLSRIAGLSYAEIARAKGATESAIRGLVARGLARICVLLENER